MKKMLSMVLCTSMCISLSGAATQVYATDSVPFGSPNATEYISPEEQLSRYLERQGLTAEQREAAVEKYNLGQSLTNGNKLARVARASSKVLSVPWFSQEEDYYCGPATLRQTVYFLNDMADPQSMLAEELGTTSTSGTDTNKMCEYLNDNTDWSFSVLWWWVDKEAFANMIVADTDDNKPIIGHITMKGYAVSLGGDGEWPFYTEGHYINYNSYSDSGETFHVTDPYADRYGITDGKYTVFYDQAELYTDRIIW